MSTVTETATTARGRRQEKIGVVVSSKMDKTVVVEVEKTITHRLYHRYQKRTSKFYAHDEQNVCTVGDRVRLVATRPLSKLKRWSVSEVLKKAGEV
jgi:small subunit ribosomal protein S17